MPGKKKAKIPLACIDEQWIEDHPDELRPTRIDMDAEDKDEIETPNEEEGDVELFDAKGSAESDSDEELYN
jgi:hypothetical protein